MLQDGHRGRVQCRALQVHEGAVGQVRVEHPGGCGGGALDAHPHGHRGQYRRQITIQATGRSRRGCAAEAPHANAFGGQDDGVRAKRPVGDAGCA